MLFQSSLHCSLSVFSTNTIPANRTTVLQLRLSTEMDCCKVGGQSVVLTVDQRSLLLRFKTPSGPCSAFHGSILRVHSSRSRCSRWFYRHEELPTVVGKHLQQRGAEKKSRKKGRSEPKYPVSDIVLRWPRWKQLYDPWVSGASLQHG